MPSIDTPMGYQLSLDQQLRQERKARERAERELEAIKEARRVLGGEK